MRRIAVALHDVEPRTFDLCAVIREWLEARGIDRVTLLVIPARDDHPFYERSPDLHAWLGERRRTGDEIAQHGLIHRCDRPGMRPRWQGGPDAEFVGLTQYEALERVLRGRDLLTRAGLPPTGFVAPAYAYTRGLRRALSGSYRWWATLLRCHSAAGSLTVPALGLGASSRVTRALTPGLLCATAPLVGSTLRLDLHPRDFRLAGHVRAIERVLDHADGRLSVGYGELLAC